MSKNLQRTAEVGANYDEWLKCDISFHTLLAQATHNELFVPILDSLADALIAVRGMAFHVPDAPSRTLKFQRAIFEQIQQANPDAARQEMREHLNEAAQAAKRRALIWPESAA